MDDSNTSLQAAEVAEHEHDGHEEALGKDNERQLKDGTMMLVIGWSYDNVVATVSNLNAYDIPTTLFDGDSEAEQWTVTVFEESLTKFILDKSNADGAYIKSGIFIEGLDINGLVAIRETMASLFRLPEVAAHAVLPLGKTFYVKPSQEALATAFNRAGVDQTQIFT